MSADEDRGIQERIERLERRLRRQNRALVICVGLIIATSLLVGQVSTSRRTLEAEEFILRGPQGQELATLDSAGSGAALALYDSQHHLRIVLRTDTQFSMVSLLDRGEKGHIALLSHADGPTVVLTGNDLKSSVSMGVLENAPNFQIKDGQDRIRGDFGMAELGPMLRMYDGRSETRTSVGIVEEVPMVAVAGPAGRGGVSISAGGTGKGSLGKPGGDILITGADGKTRSVVAIR